MKRSILDALGRHAPKEDPVLKALPMGNIAVGSMVVVTWLGETSNFRINAVYPNETADLEEITTGARINTSICDLRERKPI